ncbi:MAG: hypothetical protein QOJ98_1240 [Acidobacteriota bacterium]|jgi:hypothetical protein|nr:hypothetical protein [Acidobacteriota bacterium]
MMRRATLRKDDGLTPEEQHFLTRAQAKFAESMNWLEFEDFAFGPRSPLFSRTRSQQDVLKHPLYTALREMWLELGVQQGRVAAPAKGESDAARRKTRGRG